MNPHLSCGGRSFELLQRWIRFARGTIREAPGVRGRSHGSRQSYYGTGESGWGVQTHQKALMAFAVAATDPDLDPALTGATREELIEQGISMLRFNLATHLTGPAACVDQKKWGNTWISVLGLERCFHAFKLLDPYLENRDRDDLRRMLVAEALWIVRRYPVRAGLTTHNHPECNLWNAALLWRAASLYPGDFAGEDWKGRAGQLIRHGISTPSSLAGQGEREMAESGGLILGPNFSESLALNHHHYLNIGYIAICLSQIALLHYGCRDLGIAEPPGLWQNAPEAWKLVRMLTFPDGRLGRIGGDTRVRYCYCQDYTLLLWHLAFDAWGDREVWGFHRGWLGLLERETAYNGDGSFLSGRCEALRAVSPLYYHRLESDRAVVLALSRLWSRTGLSLLPPPDFHAPPASASGEPEPPRIADWSDACHGSHASRTPRCLMSWTWRAAEPPQGLFVPLGRSDLAEWRSNLAGEVRGLGRRNYQEIQAFHSARWEGGFATAGVTHHVSDGFVAEGQPPAILAEQFTACVALARYDFLFVLQFCRTLRRCELTSVKGVRWNIPNDVFNGFSRTYTSGKEEFVSRQPTGVPDVFRAVGQSVTVDGCASIERLYGDGSWKLDRPGRRNVGLKLYANRDYTENPGTLLCEELCLPLRLEPFVADQGEVLYDVGCRLSLADAAHPEISVESIPISDAGGDDGLPGSLRGFRLSAGSGPILGVLFNAGSEVIRIPVSRVWSEAREAAPLGLANVVRLPDGTLEFSAAGIAVLGF